MSRKANMSSELKRFQELYKSLTQNNKLIHVGLLLQRAAKNWPDNVMVICDDVKITYKELYHRASIYAKQLKELGVKPKDRVVLYYENSIEFYIAYFAIWQSGGIIAPLNVFLTDVEVAHIIKDAEPSAIIVSQELKSRLDKHQTKLPSVIVGIDSINSYKKEETNIPERDIDDLAALLYTSGTTGFPKGVMLSSKNIITNTIQGISRLETSPDDTVFCALPLFHSLPQNTCIWSNVVLGSTAIITSKIDRKNIINALKHKPTFIVAVPALYGLFCKLKTLDFSSVRYFFSGGDALSDKIRAYFSLIYRRKLCNGYGLTETSPFIAVDMDDYMQPTSTIGIPFIGITCSIRDGNKKLENGKTGVLWIKGDNVMLGYYKAPEATSLILQDGWFNTGDLAYIDKNEKIVLTGREKDLIKQKGINVFPQEIENVLLSHSKIMQAGVVGLKNDDEEIIMAFVASDEQDHQTLSKELLELCKRNLAAYKIPKKFIIKKMLPLTSTDKIDKKQLKVQLAEEKK